MINHLSTHVIWKQNIGSIVIGTDTGNSFWHTVRVLPLACRQFSVKLPVSSAHDERAFSCLKRVKTYLRSTMSEHRLSNLACISINREHVSSIAVRDLQKPFLNARTWINFNLLIRLFLKIFRLFLKILEHLSMQLAHCLNFVKTH